MPNGKQPRVNWNEGSAGRVVLFLGIMCILYFARGVLVPLAFALIFAFLLAPAVIFLNRIGVARVPAVVFTVIVATAAVTGAGWLIATQLVEVANQLPGYRENIHRKLEALQMPKKGALGQAARSLKEIGQEVAQAPLSEGKGPGASDKPIAVQVAGPNENQITEIWRLARPSLAPLAATGIVLIFTVFILIEKEDLRNRLLRLAGTNQLNVMTEALGDAGKRVSHYLALQGLVNFGVGLVIGVGLYFIGVPNAALWGIVAGVLRVVPYVGTITASFLPLALSLAVFDSWGRPLMVLVLFAAVELTVANLIEPMVYGVHTGISSLALLVATVFWAALWGPAGLILSTPLTVCLVVLGRNFPQFAFLHILLADEPALPPAAHLYQRLLAMDPLDARIVVDAFLKDGSLTQLYDTVLAPALTMAEQDRHRGAIDSEREEFLFLNVNEMITEFSEYAEDSQDAIPFTGRILCIPAHDQADEIAAAMLAQLLDQRGCAAVSFPGGAELDQMLHAMVPEAGDVICISAIQPYAFAPARTICRRVRSHFPEIPLIVGIWGFAGDPAKAMARFDRTPPDNLYTSFEQVIEHVRTGDRVLAHT